MTTASLPAARALSPWIVRLARLGYAAKGVVYVVIGALAARAAAGLGGGTTDQRGAVRAIGDGPFGTVALAIVGVGLLGYMVWRLVGAATDAERKGDDATSIAVRLSQAARGIGYGLLGVTALRAMDGAASAPSNGTQTRDWTARLLALPFGRLVVMAIGLGIVAYALYQIYRAVSERVKAHLDLARAGDKADAIVAFGRFGTAARAVVFALIGVFLVQAARSYDPSKAGGIGDSLDALGHAPYGRVVLAVIAVGLIAYGLYELATARYRRMR